MMYLTFMQFLRICMGVLSRFSLFYCIEWLRKWCIVLLLVEIMCEAGSRQAVLAR